MTLFHRLLLLIFGVGLTPIVPTGLLLFYYQSSAKTNTLGLYSGISGMAASTIRQNFDNLTRRLAFTGQLENYSKYAPGTASETLIRQTMNANPDFLLVAVLDEKGRELFKFSHIY